MALILRNKKDTWGDGIIPFEIKEQDFTTDALKNIFKAIKYWNDKTNWKIIQRNGHEDYVVFENGGMCRSDVGRQGEKQSITLSNNCGLGTTIHEIGHAVGFKHEHTRNDRDNYVVVMEDRVQPNKLGNFKKVSPDKYRDYGNYDYGSIMHYAKSSFRKINKINLGRGWTTSEFYRTSEGMNLFLLNKNNGKVKIYSIGRIFIGREIERYVWTKGWTSNKFYTINGQTYFHQIKEKGKSSAGYNVHIHKINNDGTLGGKVKYYKYSEGWSNVEFYEINGQTYRLMSKNKGYTSSGKNFHIDKMNGDGTVGSIVKQYRWTKGWTSNKFYTINGQTYFHQIKEKGKSSAGYNVHIHKINNDGTLGEKVKYYKYSEGWSNVEFYEINGQTYRLMSKNKGYTSSEKNFHIDKMNGDGTVGSTVERYGWTEGWTNVNLYENNGEMHIFLFKVLSGRTAIHLMKDGISDRDPEGGVGLEMRVQPGINIYAPVNIGSNVLSNGDIAAANSLI